MDQLAPTNEKEGRAIQLKYAGNSYAEIAKNVGVEHSTVKAWFMRSGKLFSAYQVYAMQESKERRDVAKRLYSANLERAVTVMGELLNSQDERVRFMAAKEVIERELGDEPLISSEDEHKIRAIDILYAIKMEREGGGLKS